MPLPLKWEFPGGKVQSPESEQEALIRELKEELSIRVRVGPALPPVDHTDGLRHIRLLPYLCRSEEVQTIRLTEHAELRWLQQQELQTLDWAEADRPVVTYLETHWPQLFFPFPADQKNT